MRVATGRASPNLFTAWRVAPAAGRPFNASDARSGSAPVVMLSDQFWRQHFGGRPDVVGRTIELDGREAEIIAVTASELQTKLMREVELWAPLTLDPDPAGRARRELTVIGRLRPDTTIEQAEAEIAQLAGDLARAYPATNARLETRVLSVAESMGQAPRMVLTLLGMSVAFLILIAYANVANLMLAQGATRARELAVRSALGAGRARLVRQLLAESVVLAVAAGALSLLLAAWSLRVLVWASCGGAMFEDLAIDQRVLQPMILLVVALPFAFALMPAVQVSKADLVDGLKAGMGGVTRRRRRVSKRDLSSSARWPWPSRSWSSSARRPERESRLRT